MHRLHAIRLALLCCTIVAVLAACGSGSDVQQNYSSLANAICGKFSDATKGNPTSAQRIQAITDALAGLQGLHPPHNAVEPVYTHLLFNFKAAVDILKPNINRLARLAKHLQAHPDDKRAARQYARLVRRVQLHLRLAAADARTLGMGRCQAAFGG